ncbi:glutamine synthetase/guanido kinase [Pholiota conissans]|uniref:Glutamine synthetase n=1 Tax=Pholiota conissans TaxID=109636 RepID=A0A9P5Z381_9AGAR|nr:glutamine synthetase/guanido kinase [Pholiota conissans]
MGTIYDHDVEYKPSTVSFTRPSVDSLKAHNVEYIRFTWVDFSNTIRFRLIPIAYFEKLLASRRPGIGLAKAALGLVNISLADGFLPMGEYLYVPDLTSFRLCPYEPGHASVMGFFEEKTPYVTANDTTSVETKICPRGTLKRVVEQAKKELGVEFLVGFENEFILLQNDLEGIEPVGTYAFSSSSSLRTGALETRVMDKIARAVQASGIELQMYHGEGAPGQYEVITGPLTPLEAADALIHTREIIYNIAASHGLRATFAPRVFTTAPGSATHSHISVHSTHPGHTKGPRMSDLEKTFLAGLTAHLPNLSAVTLPIPASYERVGDGKWSGGTHVCWGTENRECPIRLASATSPSSRRFEMRFLDATANPYLALAGILGAGILGIRAQTPLTLVDCRGPLTAAQMTDAQRLEHGITARMPLTWEEARENFQKDSELKDIFGQELVDMYFSVNKAVGEALAKHENEGGLSQMQRLVKFY